MSAAFETGTAQCRLFTAIFQPAANTFGLDKTRETFIELRVARDIQTLVSEFVENDAGQSIGRQIHHRIEQGIGETSKRRICRYAADKHVVAGGAQGRGERIGAVSREIAAVTDAAGYRKTPRMRLE